MSSFNDRGKLDTSKGMILVFQGKKRSGKSVLALYTFRSFPGDKLVIDIAADDGPTGPGVTEITGSLATGDLDDVWPEYRREDDHPMIVRYVPNPKSPTFIEDIDAVVGMAIEHSTKEKPVMLLIHEQGVAAKANSTKPHMTAALMHNRHHGLNLLLCMPRAMNVEPLSLAQADLVYTFEQPSKADRARTAETIGWDLGEYTAAIEALGPNEYTRFDANESKPPPAPAGVDVDVWENDHPDNRFLHFEALPLDVVQATEQWAHNVPKPAPR